LSLPDAVVVVGMDDYLAKPVPIQDLDIALRKATAHIYGEDAATTQDGLTSRP
jgi:ActR/RegA family two-component response regulator